MAKQTARSRAKKPATKPTARSRKPPTARGKQPTQPPLIKGARIAALDEACESIGEIRDSMAELRADEKTHKGHALTAMRKHNRTTWKHAGVELARVPGEEKLRVRKTKGENVTAEVTEDLPEPAPSVEDTAIAEIPDEALEPIDGEDVH